MPSHPDPPLLNRLRLPILCIVLFLLPLLSLLGEAPGPATDAMAIAPDRGAAGMTRWLRALQTRASLMLVTAHPDDEDGGMLAYEVRGQGARASLMTLTRGEGGQNVMSQDFYDALGLARTQELLIADRYMGVDQYFSLAVDYGFSKTREEALEKWGYERVLSDAVRVVRMTRPLVVMSVFLGAATDGHGNHQVAGQMAQEVFDAAGDPARFPEQIREGLRPWSPLKVYARVPFFQVTPSGMYDYAIDKFVPVRFFDYITRQAVTHGPDTTLEIPEGLAAPAAGMTFVQIAREGLGFQKTQNGGGEIPRAAPVNSAYHRMASRVAAADHEASFFEGIDISIPGIASLAAGQPKFLMDGLAALARPTAEALREYRADRPAAIAPLLAEGLKQTRDLMAQVESSAIAEPGKGDVLFELNLKEQQYQTALAAALEISFQTAVAAAEPSSGGRGAPAQSPTDAAFAAARAGRGLTPTFTVAVPGQSFAVETQLYNESPEALAVDGVHLEASDGKRWQFLQQWRFAVTAPRDAALTRPYFSRPNDEQPYYDLNDARYRNLPAAPYPLAARARLVYRGVPFEVAQVVQTNERVAGLGVMQNPLLMGPAISVWVSPAAGAAPIGAKSIDFTATVHSNVKGPANGTLRLHLPDGWRSAPPQAPFSFTRDGEDQTVTFAVSPSSVKPAEYTISAVAEYEGREYSEGYHLTGYAGLRPYPYYRPSTYRAVGVEVETAPGLKIGFLPGTGDDVPKALENLGLKPRILAAGDLTSDLSEYDAIILGVRAYAVRADLKAANNRLMEYVKNGGVLIVQYNAQDFDHDYGPYPFSLGNNPEKVVDENAPVTLLQSSNPAFGWPNKIVENDFKGWVEERGHGFMRSWDPRYTPLVETHDPDQDPQKGGLLLARYGKGFYLYDALALYRQLPSGVPGAYRILANLVSLGKNPEWK
jgi:LmbE family N-acetylglucosaminyl deacetylase